MARYSKRTLVEKLGIQPTFVITFIDQPNGYEKTLGPLPQGVTIALIEEGLFDFIQYFATDLDELAHMFPILKRHIKPSGMIWISWRKGTTDMNENLVREIGLKHGLVDVKVIAVDEIWSGLKFVYRLADRG